MSAVTTTNNPYQGLKLRIQLEHHRQGTLVTITNNPYQGLKQNHQGKLPMLSGDCLLLTLLLL